MQRFQVTHCDDKARAGILYLSENRNILTPVFMPVATQGVIKTLIVDEMKTLGIEMILANAYHLYLRPGIDIIAQAGGLHRFSDWNRGIITDSGGFQVFSLSKFRKISENGIEFKSHLDGSTHFFTPESNMQLQQQLGADIIMALDVCVAYPASVDDINESVRLTTNWAKRCKKYIEENITKQSLFGIIQGGVIKESRLHSARELIALDLPGYAIGGLSVGEGREIMNQVLELLHPVMPENKPRYLMGVGTPLDLWDGVARGIDMFDCAMPTRIARNGTLFTSNGRLVIKNGRYAKDFRAPDPNCNCYLCTHHHRAYLRHLFNTNEITALRLSTLHNLTFMINLMRLIRAAIQSGTFKEAYKAFLAQYLPGENPV